MQVAILNLLGFFPGAATLYADDLVVGSGSGSLPDEIGGFAKTYVGKNRRDLSKPNRQTGVTSAATKDSNTNL